MKPFNLDTAVAAWRQSLTYNRAFDIDDLDELERHLRDQVDALVAGGVPMEAAYRQAVRHMGAHPEVEAEYRKVYWGKRRLKGEATRELLTRVTLIGHAVKLAFRGLRRRPGYTLINLAGLSVGLAAAMLIGLFLRHEWSYDRFHEHADRLHRLVYDTRMGTGLPSAAAEDWKPRGTAAIGPLLEAAFTDVERVVRLSGRHQILLARGDRAFQEERYFFADPAFFEVFGFPLLDGDPVTALAAPNGIVLTASAARRYFGDEPAMGKTLRLGEDPATAAALTVTGVMADLPSNTHLDFDMLIAMRTFENAMRADGRNNVFDHWGYVDFFTYVLLREGSRPDALEAQFPAFVERNAGDAFHDPPQTFAIALEPIAEAYHSATGGIHPGPRGNAATLYLFGVIGGFIVLIACINFTNMATAQSIRRAKEVGVRKSMGAQRGGLVGQFLAEAMLLVGIAMGLAVALATASLPMLRVLTDRPIPLHAVDGPWMLAVLAASVVLVGVMAGGYPAIVLASFGPAHMLKGGHRGARGGAALRRGLVVVQFASAIVLVVGTLVVYEQLTYLQSRPLGFDDRQQLVLDFGGDAGVRAGIDAIEQALEGVPGVERVAATRSIPGGHFPLATIEIEAPDGAMRGIVPGLYEVDVDFLPQIGVEAAAGRLFRIGIATDATEALLINEAAARELGYARPADVVGKRFAQWGREGEVIGVVKDFNYQSLHHAVQPLTFRVSTQLNYLVLDVSSGDARAAAAQVEGIWSRMVPHRPFRYAFLDQSFDAQYRAEQRFGLLFGVFAALAIFIACLGLFGLATYSAQQRTKEIGVRKVLGASATGLVTLLAKEFVGLVAVGFVAAAPIAYVVMERWLQGFAYRVDVGARVLLLAGAVSVAVALLSVGYQAMRAALADPVRSLRYE